MTTLEAIKKIRIYALVSFIIPLIAINSCFLIYKALGDLKIERYPDLNWEQPKHQYDFIDYNSISNIKNYKTNRFVNCPPYNYTVYHITNDNKKIPVNDENSTLNTNLIKKNKVKSVIIEHGNTLNESCVKNYPFLNSLFTRFVWLESLLIDTMNSNVSGFGKIKNPYLYGEVSISRTARFFPSIIIFKFLIILSAFFLMGYWINNLKLLKEFKNLNILKIFSKKFFYFGILSCIFLILHATFLGLDSGSTVSDANKLSNFLDSKIFAKIRRLVIILFILFEVTAQILLTINLFKFRDNLKQYINPLILKIKITFVLIIILITLVSAYILSLLDPAASFKHTLEWNYFAFLLFYYLLSMFLWKKIN